MLFLISLAFAIWLWSSVASSYSSTSKTWLFITMFVSVIFAGIIGPIAVFICWPILELIKDLYIIAKNALTQSR